MPDKLMDYFNNAQRFGTLSTSSKDGKVNSGHFGSPFMVNPKTIIIGLTKNRTFANLQENPHAVFTIMEPGKTLAEWKGVRVYVKMIDCTTAGEKLNKIKDRIASGAGEAVAKLIHASVVFEVQEVRPLADFGQGWQRSI